MRRHKSYNGRVKDSTSLSTPIKPKMIQLKDIFFRLGVQPKYIPGYVRTFRELNPGVHSSVTIQQAEKIIKQFVEEQKKRQNEDKE